MVSELTTMTQLAEYEDENIRLIGIKRIADDSIVINFLGNKRYNRVVEEDL